MGVEERLDMRSYEAAGDLSANQYLFVLRNSSGQVAVAGDGVLATGVLQNKPAAQGREAAVAVGGRTKVVYGGTVTTGDSLASDASGKAVIAVTGDNVLGEAEEDGVADDVGSMEFRPNGTGP